MSVAQANEQARKLRRKVEREIGELIEQYQIHTGFATWHCPKALVRHLEREFESIQIVEPEDAAA